ncbi:MAG: ABC transporter permease [Actinobacteria bacterium]|nr:ABC transporter permease [Actinomycetota bacterium]
MSSAAPADALPGQRPEYEFAVEPRSQWALTRRRFLRHRLAAVSLLIFAFVVTAGLFAGPLAPYEYTHIDVHALNAGPSWSHLFGTDSVGHDYFSRVLVGLGVEVRIVLLVGVFGTLIGMLLGATAGYFGGLFDNLVMRGIDVLLTMPPLVVLLVGASYLHATTLVEISILIACVVWMPVARVVRASCLSLREMEYIEAARAMGASDVRIIVRQVLPNASGTVAVAASLMTAGAVILETTIAFLGFG